MNVDLEGVAREEGLETEPVQAGADEDESDEHIGNPGENSGHAVVNVLLDLLLGQPGGVPLVALLSLLSPGFFSLICYTRSEK